MSDQRDFTTARYWVRQMFETPTRHAGPTRYEISLFAADAHVPHTLVTTIDPWKASLCQRAIALSAPSLVTWRKTKYGHELVSIHQTDERPLLERLIPHDGYFGMSGWVLCQAPTCVCPEIGISRGERNYVDPKTNQHWHVECYEVTKGLESGAAFESARERSVDDSVHTVGAAPAVSPNVSEATWGGYPLTWGDEG